ncbi:MAG: translocation/assembly module TamB domain-containing protein [Burkholderiales bacterium]|nr:translocation/assembly module TamB domain-containing protein [Burkholderiales bacterium]
MPPPATPPEPAAPAPPRGGRIVRLLGQAVRLVGRVARRIATLGLLVTAHTLSLSVLVLSLVVIGLGSLPYTATGSRWVLQAVPGLQVGATRGVLFGDFDADELTYVMGSRRLVIRRLSWRGLDLAPPGQGRPDWTLSLARLNAAEIDLQGEGDGKPLVLPTDLTLPLAIRADLVEIGSIRTGSLGPEPLRNISGTVSLGAGTTTRHRVDKLRLSWDRLDAAGQASIGAAAPLAIDAAFDLAPRVDVDSAATATAPPPLADAWRARVTALGPLADFELAATARARGQSLDAQARVRLQDRQPLAHLLARLSGLDLAAFASTLPTTALTGDILADLGAPPAPSGQRATSAAPAPDTAASANTAPPAMPITVQADLRNDLPARWDQGGLPVHRLRIDARSDVLAPLQGQVQRLEIDFAGNSAPPTPAAAAAAASTNAASVATASTPPATSGAGLPPVAKPSPARAPAAVAAGSLSGRGSWALVGTQRHLELQTDATLADFQTALLDTRAPNLIVSGPLSLGYDQTFGPASQTSAQSTAKPAPTASSSAARPSGTPDTSGRTGTSGSSDTSSKSSAAAAAQAPSTTAASAPADGPRLTLATDLSGRLSRYPPGGARTRGAAEARRAALGNTPADVRAGQVVGEVAPGSNADWPLVRLRLKAAAQASGVQIEQLDAQSGAARLRASGQVRHHLASWQLVLQSTLDDFDPTLWWPGAVDTPWQRGPHRLAGELQAELSLSDQAIAASPDTLARLASLNGNTRLHLRSSVLAGVPVAGTLDLHAGTATNTDTNAAATTTAPGQASQALPGATPPSDRQFDAASGPRVQVHADISAGERALPDSGLSQGGLGLTLRGQLDPLGNDDRWQISWQARSLDALTPWLRLAGTSLTLDGDLRGDALVTGRWPQLRSRGSLDSERLLIGKRPAIEADSTAAARTTSVTLDTLHGSWTAGSAGQDPLSIDATLDKLRAAGISGADFQAVKLMVKGTGADHQLNLRSQWLRTPAATSSAGTGNGTGAGAGAGAGANTATATASSTARAAANAAGSLPAAGSAEADSVVPRRWLLALDATGGWSPTRLSPLAVGLGGIGAAARGTPVRADAGYLSWQGRIDQLQLRELVSNGATTAVGSPATSASAPAAGASSNGSHASNGGTWVIGLAPTRLGLGFGQGETQVLLGATRLRLAELGLAIDTFAWRSRDGQSEPDIDLRARIEPMNVAPLLARAQPGFGWRGDLQLGGRLTLKTSAQAIDADFDLARIGGDLVVIDPDNPAGPQQLDLRQFKLALRGHNGVWKMTEQVEGANLGSLVGEQMVRAAGPAQWPGRNDPVTGRLDLQVAQLGNWGRWLPAGWRLSGRLTTQAHITGRLGAPELSGELVGQRIAIRNGLQGVDWTDARLRVTLAGEQAHIDELVVKGGAGTLQGRGLVQLGARPGVVLSLTADRFAALQRVDRKLVVSGTAELSVDARATTIKGKLRADEGRIDVSQGDAPGLADDVIVIRPEADAAAARDRVVNPRSRRGLALDISADLGDNFQLSGRGITTNLAGVLLITSPNDRLAINGTIRAVDGSYAAYGQKLSIDRGLITFGGPAENPRLDIRATRPDLDDVTVGIEITGTAQSPRVRLFSEPEMSNTDKLSWLLLGRASDGLGSTDLSLLQRAAFSLMAGESDSPSIIQRLGLDQLSLRQTEGTVRETIVSLGKQLSRRWYVGYERSLNAATGSWQLIYRLAQRFTLRAQSGVDNAIDLIWTWKWGEAEAPRPAGTAPPRAAEPAASRP